MKFETLKKKSISDSAVIEIPIAYTGTFDGYSGGSIELTSEMFDEAVNNFNKEPLKIPLYKGHADCQMSLTGEEPPSMGWILGLTHDENYLYAQIELTKEMEDLIAEGKYKYCSIYMKNDIDRKTGEDIGNRLYSLAITNQPFLDELPEIRLSKNSKQDNIYFSKGLEMKKIKKFTKDDVTSETLPEAKEAEKVMEGMQEGKTEDSTFDLTSALEEMRNAIDPEMTMEDFVKYLADMMKAEATEETVVEPEEKEPATEMAVSTEESVKKEETSEAKKEETAAEDEETAMANKIRSKLTATDATLSAMNGLNIALSKANDEIKLLKKKVQDHENEVVLSIVQDAVSRGKLLDVEKSVFIELGKTNKKLFDDMLKARNIKPAVVLSRISQDEVEQKNTISNDITSKMSAAEKRVYEAFKKSK